MESAFREVPLSSGPQSVQLKLHTQDSFLCGLIRALLRVMYRDRIYDVEIQEKHHEYLKDWAVRLFDRLLDQFGEESEKVL